MGKLKEATYRSYIKMGDSKENVVNIRLAINIVCYRGKTIAFYDNANELLNQRLKILNVCRHRKAWLFGE